MAGTGTFARGTGAEVTAAATAFRRRLRLARRVFGGTLGAATVLAAALFLLGAWNPWDLVVLRYWFGNPPLGLLLVGAAGLLAHWLALPITNEARQGKRIGARISLTVLTVVGLIAAGIFANHFRFHTEVLARSGDNGRAVVLVTGADRYPTSYLRIWVGSGPTAREVGDLGRVCYPNHLKVRFITDDAVEMDQGYGPWRFELDPATGEPQHVLGPRCPDGPVPAGY